MPASFTIARNPEPGTRLPFLLRLPVEGGRPVILACRERWPGVKDAYCHDGGAWPDDAEVVESVPVVACWRDGQAIHLTLDRKARRRSMFVWTRKGDRTLIFWRTPKTMTAARPGLKVPAARDFGDELTVAVDIAERYAWTFPGQHAATVRRRLPVGDYGVLDAAGRLVAVVERKGAGEVASKAVGGTLAFALAELSTAPRAVLIVEGRLSDVLKAPGDKVSRSWLLSTLAALQATYPQVAWVFADNRALAEDYGYRWLAAAGKAAMAATAATGDGTPGSPPDPVALRIRDDDGPFSPLASTSSPAATPQAIQRPLVVRDRAGRLDEAMALAGTGLEWTPRGYAEHFGVSAVTASVDLKALVEAGALAARGAGRGRRYVGAGG